MKTTMYPKHSNHSAPSLKVSYPLGLTLEHFFGADVAPSLTQAELLEGVVHGSSMDRNNYCNIALRYKMLPN